MTELHTDTAIDGAPSDFELESQDVQVSFSETSFTGEPRFHYRDSRREVNVGGEEIRQVETEFGKLVTITLGPEVDGGRLLFTLLVPRARVSSDTRSVHISTQGIITRVLTPRGPPQLQTYSVTQLEGVGKAVDA